MEVNLLEHMGNDNSICDAARVSFSKKATQYTGEQNTNLLKYLARHNHWSPFAHTSLKFHIKAPIFVARQLAKHQVGLVWNEVSRRYVSTTPEVWQPEVLRQAAASVKQGSSSEVVSDNEFLLNTINNFTRCGVTLYETLLKAGVCPEQARMVLPLASMTEWIWTGSLYAFFRVYTLRSTPSVQAETQEIAALLGQQIQPIFPVAWLSLMNTLTKEVK